MSRVRSSGRPRNLASANTRCQDNACLQNQALLLLLLLGEKSCACRMLEDFSNPLIRLGRALQVLVCTDLLADVLGL